MMDTMTVDDSHKRIAAPGVKYNPKHLGNAGLGRCCSLVPRGVYVAIPKRGHPTSYLPGTGEKLIVMSERYTRREPLCHPYDAVYSNDLLPLLFQLLTLEERDKVVALYSFADTNEE